MYPRCRDCGFTLIELVITVAILALIAAFAAPSFSRLIADNQVATETNQLLSTLQFARSEAVKRGETVTVTADSNDFGNGWCVHIGADCHDADREIRVFGAQSANFTTDPNSMDSVSFNRRGERDSADPGITLKPSDCQAGDAGRKREITVEPSGRASLEKVAC